MSVRRWLVPVVLLVLFAAIAAGLHATRELDAAPAPPGGGEAEGRPGAEAGAEARAAGPSKPPAADGARNRRRQRPFDLQVLLTARRLPALAESPEEVELAEQAQRLADHAVDLAFHDTLQRIAEDPPEPTPELRALAETKARAAAALAAAQAQAEALARAQEEGGAAAPGPGQVELARARVELARDELDDASDALARAGGDPQARIERLRAQYEAAQKVPAAAPAGPPPASRGRGSLLERLRAWSAQRAKVAALEEARAEVLARIQAMEQRRERVTKRIAEAEALERKALGAATAAVDAGSSPAAQVEPAAASAEHAGAVRRLARDRRRLNGLARRLQDHQELADVYADWSAIAGAQARSGLHRVLQRGVWVLVALAFAWLASRLVERSFGKQVEGDVRAGTLHGVVRVAVGLAAALAILLIAVGAPSQATTIVGLAGAGLTVALRNFIVAFFGWFVLMGRNGIRVGDWVEIKGVGGEVAEIGLLHTVLLETGSWSDAGHPTGRRVSFVNSFAVEGHYFNFTSSGQWMWDTLPVLVPLGQDPYPVLDGVQRLVEKETQENAKLAEQEWRKTTSRYRVRTFSAVPGINVLPTANGVQLDVRYITRAHERHDTRRRLSHAVVQLMHGKREAG
ncbi:MAG TPA: mechanosensitive ion channel domain-containing protein [Anaeromyxobacter sp.]|nr:mechanosensitive ion channel domain-containing protein [Anaeromyxobacter sp.]